MDLNPCPDANGVPPDELDTNDMLVLIATWLASVSRKSAGFPLKSGKRGSVVRKDYAEIPWTFGKTIRQWPALVGYHSEVRSWCV